MLSYNVTKPAYRLPALCRILTAQQPYYLRLSHQSVIVSVAFTLFQYVFKEEVTYCKLTAHLTTAISVTRAPLLKTVDLVSDKTDSVQAVQRVVDKFCLLPVATGSRFLAKICTLPSTKKLTDKDSNQPLVMQEHDAAKKPVDVVRVNAGLTQVSNRHDSV